MQSLLTFELVVVRIDPLTVSASTSLDLATRVFRASPTSYHAETVAMALAETGRCGEAASWQRQVLSAAEAHGDSSHNGELERVLARYESGPPCRMRSRACATADFGCSTPNS